MGKTLGLSQIVKNEEHVIERSLNSIKGIVDYITIVDTGSQDNTISVIENFCKENNIPFDIYQREFDNFENSRNYAMEMAQGKTDYCFWLDSDEVIEIDENFNKNKLNKDIYMFNTFIGDMKYTRNECWKNDGNFKWYGPVHEYIVPKDKSKPLTSAVMPGVSVKVRMDGGSWQQDIEKKYRQHARVLEEYIDEIDRNPRWIFYTAQSYHDSAKVKGNIPENKERLRRSLKYYKERVDTMDGYHEERFYSQLRIGVVMSKLENPWGRVKEELLKAYKMDPLRGEPFKFIIEYYQKVGDWDMAYLYSKFAYTTFHKSNPYPKRLLYVDKSVYEWRFAELYSNACYYTGRKQQAVKANLEILNSVKNNEITLSNNDLQRIQKNGQFFVK